MLRMLRSIDAGITFDKKIGGMWVLKHVINRSQDFKTPQNILITHGKKIKQFLFC